VGFFEVGLLKVGCCCCCCCRGRGEGVVDLNGAKWVREIENGWKWEVEVEDCEVRTKLEMFKKEWRSWSLGIDHGRYNPPSINVRLSSKIFLIFIVS
jgi:hypothetical protein